jgi:Protein of unknown function (DUF559)
MGDEVCIGGPIDPKCRPTGASPRQTLDDSVIAKQANAQHGVVARRQLLAAGFSADEVRGRLRCGRLHRLHGGVYAVGHRVLSAEGRLMAAVLAAGPQGVLSHRSAAQLWGLLPPWHGAVEVTRARKSRQRPRIRVHFFPLPSDEVDAVDAIPVTSAFRTIFDLAAVARPREVERAFHEAEVRRLTDRVSLPLLLERYPGRRGVGVIRAILVAQEPQGITQNDFEERFLGFLDANGFPRPLLNRTLPLRGRLLKPDCMWPRERLVVELDGREVHGTDRSFEGDRRRDRQLLAEGWRSIRVTWRHLRDEPDEVAADLRLALFEPSPSPTPPAK